MSQGEIRITAEPVDNHRCKFVVSQPLHATGVRRFASADEAKGSPLAEAIFAIPAGGVTEVIVSGNIVTVVKDNPAPWPAVGKAVGVAIRAAAASGAPAVATKTAPPPGAVDDDALYERVARLFDELVDPIVARHRGRVQLIELQED